MDTTTSLLDRKHWSNNRFAWVYAGFISILAILFAIILKSAGVYEGVALRSINIFFILFGFILLIWDLKRTTHRHLTYTQAFQLLIRAGFYFCLLFLPILLIFIDTFHDELNIVRENETFTSDFPVIQIVFSTYLETVATVVIGAMAISYTANWSSKKKSTV